MSEPGDTLEPPEAGPRQETHELGRLPPTRGGSTRAGRVIADRYRLDTLLGRGGVGCVMRARDLRAERDVAVKLLLAGELRPDQRARFEREGELAAAVRHPGVVQVHAAGIAEDDRPYLVYELIDGAQTLKDRMDQVDLKTRVEWIRQAAEALGAAHVAGIVHRDIKPANILIDGEGRARVTDFGAAMQGELARLTRSGVIVGTPLYMAPEQLMADREAIRPATDVWALGVLLYLAVCGEAPFQADNLASLIAQVLSGSYIAPTTRVPELPTRLAAVIARCLKREPWRRYPDGAALASALATAFDPAPRWPRALAGGALTVAIAVGVWRATSPAPTPPPTLPPTPVATPTAAPTAAPTPTPALDTTTPAWTLKVPRLRWAAWADGGRRVVVSSVGRVALLDAATRRDVRTWETGPDACQLAVSPDGATIAFGGSGRMIRIVAARDGAERRVLTTPSTINALLFSPASDVLAVGGDWATTDLHPVQGGVPIRVPNGGTVNAVAWSRGGLLAVGGEGTLERAAHQTLRVWDLKATPPTRRLERAFPGRIQHLRFHPRDPEVVFVADALGAVTQVHLGDASSARFETPAFSTPMLRRAHDGRVTWIEPGPEGRRIATTTRGRGRERRRAELRVWALDTRSCVFVHASEHAIERAIRSPDGALMLLTLPSGDVVEAWPTARFFPPLSEPR